MHRASLALAAAVLATSAAATSALAQSRAEITVADSGVTPENLTASRDGTVYFGSTSRGTIYRAAPGASRAEAWILASAADLTNVLGVLAHDASNTLWVCQNTTGGRGGTPVSGQAALRAFDLATGAAKGRHALPPNAGVCNDIAVAADGTVYVTESFRGRVHRLRPGASALELWFEDAQTLNGVDGIALLADGTLYVNDFFSGRFYRIPIDASGNAGALVPIETSVPFTRPDGLRTVGPRTMLQAEGQGRLTEITIVGDRAEVRVLQEGLAGATGVTLVGETAFVLVGRSKAVAVPYRPR